MNDCRKHTRKVQKYLIRKHQRQALLEKITDTVTCWIPIICTCSIVLSMPKGNVPFLQWTITGEAMAVLALAMLTPWGLYQMDHKCFEKPSDKWLLNILPTECVLWVIYCRIQPNLAIAFFLIGIIGSMLWRFSQKKDRNRYAAIVMTIALFIPSYYAVNVIKSDIRLMCHELYLFIVNGEESEYADKRNMASVPKCSDEEWIKMNSEEKLVFLREIVSHETAYMCIPEILVCMETLNRDGEQLVLGKYDVKRNEILIDSGYLLKATYLACLETILHECRHAMQHHVVDYLLDWKDETVQTHIFFEQARQWKESFKSDDDDRIEAYYWDSTEVDARAYAEDRMFIYYESTED